MGLVKEFKDFAVRGNVIDLAVGVVIGAAFGKIVGSLVSDILMPPIGMLTGGITFSEKFLALDGQTYASIEEATKAGAAVLTYGRFIDAIIQFLIVAFAIFLVIRQINKLTKKPDAPPPATTRDCPKCLSAIQKKATRCAYCTAEIVPVS